MALLDWLRGRQSETPTTVDLQHQVCARFGAKCVPVAPGTKVGIALQTLGLQPLNALRQRPEGGTCGWYVWWGDTLNEDPEFFQPLHVEHLPERCPAVVPYLSLPPGWRVQVAPGHEDVWFDAELLKA
jgi:hypothetical protein